MLKRISAATINILEKLLNETLETGTFPDSLKLADIFLFFEKNNPLNKTSHLVNVFLVVSKLFEKIMQKQINGSCLSKYLCAYRKCYNTEQILPALIEK